MTGTLAWLTGRSPGRCAGEVVVILVSVTNESPIRSALPPCATLSAEEPTEAD